MNRFAITTLALVFLTGLVLMPIESSAGRRGFGGHRGGSFKSFSPGHKFSGKRFSGTKHRSFDRRLFGSHGSRFRGGHFKRDRFFRHGHFGKFGHFGHRHFPRTRFFFGLNLHAPFAYYPYSSYSPSYESEVRYVNDSQLHIDITPAEAEIWVDGRYVGLARDFSGPAILYVAPGSHVVEVKLHGQISTTQVTVAPGATSVVKMVL